MNVSRGTFCLPSSNRAYHLASIYRSGHPWSLEYRLLTQFTSPCWPIGSTRSPLLPPGQHQDRRSPQHAKSTNQEWRLCDLAVTSRGPSFAWTESLATSRAGKARLGIARGIHDYSGSLCSAHVGWCFLFYPFELVDIAGFTFETRRGANRYIGIRFTHRFLWEIGMMRTSEFARTDEAVV